MEVVLDLEEHHLLKTVLDELHDMDPDDERFPAKTEVLAEVVEHHHEEEAGVLAGITEHWDDARRAETGERFAAAERVAPTRPHPHLPDEGGFVAAAQGFAATLDRLLDGAGTLRDAVRKNLPGG